MASGVSSARRERRDGRDFRAASVVWLGQDLQPRLMVNADLKLVWSNDAGAELLAGCHELEVYNGVLTTANRALQPAFAAFVGKASSILSTWQVPRRDEQEFLLLRATRLDDDLVGIAANRTGAGHMPRFVDLDRAFGLTASELRVLTGLLSGEEADKLARMHGVSLETTRTHIRNLYLKMGVSSRESLFARALPFHI